MITDDAAGGIAHGGSGVEANEGLAIFAVQSDFDAFGNGLVINFAGNGVALVLVDENIADALAEEFFTGVIAKHTNESRIDLEDFVVGSDDVDAFLQGFEELGKTRFVATHGSDIASENGEAVDFAITDHGVGSAIEEVNGVESLDADLDGTIPLAALNEASQFAGDRFGRRIVDVFDEMAERLANNFLEGMADEIGKAAIDGANFAIEAEGEQEVVEGVNKIAESLLGFGNHLEEMFELIVAGKFGVFFVATADQAFEFGNFLSLFPDVGAEESDEDDESNGEGFEMEFFGAQGIPGEPAEDYGDSEKDEEGEAPKVALAIFELFEARFRRGAGSP